MEVTKQASATSGAKTCSLPYCLVANTGRMASACFDSVVLKRETFHIDSVFILQINSRTKANNNSNPQKQRTWKLHSLLQILFFKEFLYQAEQLNNQTNPPKNQTQPYHLPSYSDIKRWNHSWGPLPCLQFSNRIFYSISKTRTSYSPHFNSKYPETNLKKHYLYLGWVMVYLIMMAMKG